MKASVSVFGKIKGTIIPAKNETKKDIANHPFFGMNRKVKKNVKQCMEKLRGGRY